MSLRVEKIDSARGSQADRLARPVLCSGAAGYFFSAATVIAVATRSAPLVA